MSNHKKDSTPVVLLIIIIGLLLVGALAYYLAQNEQQSAEATTCNLDNQTFADLYPAIEKYNYCSDVGDCVVVHGTICGFQSGLLVNKDEVDKVKGLITSCSPVPPTCHENGDSSTGVRCMDHQCTFMPEANVIE